MAGGRAGTRQCLSLNTVCKLNSELLCKWFHEISFDYFRVEEHRAGETLSAALNKLLAMVSYEYFAAWRMTMVFSPPSPPPPSAGHNHVQSCKALRTSDRGAAALNPHEEPSSRIPGEVPGLDDTRNKTRDGEGGGIRT